MFDLKVVPDEGDEYEITAKSRDIARWERRFKGRSMAQLTGERMSMVALTELAFVTASRLGHFGGSLAEFEDSVDIDIQDGDEDETDEDGETDPTEPDR